MENRCCSPHPVARKTCVELMAIVHNYQRDKRFLQRRCGNGRRRNNECNLSLISFILLHVKFITNVVQGKDSLHSSYNDVTLINEPTMIHLSAVIRDICWRFQLYYLMTILIEIVILSLFALYLMTLWKIFPHFHRQIKFKNRKKVFLINYRPRFSEDFSRRFLTWLMQRENTFSSPLQLHEWKRTVVPKWH